MRTSLVIQMRLGILVALLISPGLLLAQGKNSSSLNVSVDLVLLDVAVHDRAGKPATNLEKEDFALYEDKVQQSIAFLSKEQTPVTWGLVLDRSGSMKGMMQEMYQSAVHILEEGTNEDEMFIVTFGDRVELISTLTSDRRQLQNSIFGLSASGPTPMYDAIATALDYIKQGKHRKKVLVVITDGENNHSAVTLRQVMSRIRESDVLIYMVGMRQTMGAFRGAMETRQNLKTMAETTGAYAYFPSTLEKCRETMGRIALEVSEHYTIGYYPTNQTDDGKWRKVKVLVKESDQEQIKYNVRTRTGYYGPQP